MWSRRVIRFDRVLPSGGPSAPPRAGSYFLLRQEGLMADGGVLVSPI